MKRYKKVWILLGVLVLCCAAAFAATKIQEQKENIRNSGEVILSLTEGDIRSVSWEQGGISLAFRKDGGGVWRWEDDEAFPVDAEQIGDMLSIFEAFTASFTIEKPENISQYGLDTPEGVIRLETSDKVYTLTLGSFSRLDEQRYLSIGDGNVYLVTVDPIDTYNVDISSLIDHDEIPRIEQADTVTFTGEHSYTLSYREDANASYCAEDVYFQDAKPLSTDLVETYLFNLSYTELTDYVSYNATEEELTAYGLSVPTLSVSVAYPDVNETVSSFTLHIGIVTEADEDGNETTTGYARVGESQIIYQLRASDRTSLLDYTYNDLRHTEVFTADVAQVAAMDITVENTTYHLEAAVVTEEDAEKTVWKYGETEISVSSVQTALEALRFNSFTEEAATETSEIRMVLHLENAYASTWEIVLYRLDGANCLCFVNGESVGLVSRSYTVDLIEAVNAIILN